MDMQQGDLSRRSFLHVAGATGAALAGGRAWADDSGTTTQQESAAAVVRHAVIGTGPQGTQHVLGFRSATGCELVAICDVDRQRRQAVAAVAPGARQVEDYRELLADPTINSISIATPDHWHAPIALAAIQAGKHVYVEKPCSHNIIEAKLLHDAAATSGLCVQHGTQWRSAPSVHQAFQRMREGAIGDVYVAKAIDHQHRERIGRAPEEPQPDGVNYELWLGPAPERPYTKNRFHYNWHWMWDFGSGDIGNDGIHQIDVARWGLGVGLPTRVLGAGGQYYYDDDHETPDHQTVVFEYGHCQLIFEMRLWTNYSLEGHDNGVVFYGTKGRIDIGRKGSILSLDDGTREELGPPPSWAMHAQNFVDAVRAKDPHRLAAPMAEAYPSTVLCHLGNIATRTRRVLQFDAEKLECTGDTEATAMFRRQYRKGYELPA